MRFLHTETYELYEHYELPNHGNPLPRYAILSHTWLQESKEGVQEITYRDMKSAFAQLKNNTFKQKGWQKLKSYCNLARKDGWTWAWMDTCCIDKANPTDTQEAINAMFRWYRESKICYAYLEDVDLKDKKSLWDSFTHAMWFTRGWTLQELIAPKFLLFVDKNWREIADKDSSLEEIEKATGIRPAEMREFDQCSIRKRFSWAALRQTTLVEDRAYSLFGLFGINMPLIYGEGDKAFSRLQHELIRKHDDGSLLVWDAHNYNEESAIPRRLGVLAPSLSCFQPLPDHHEINALLGCNLSTTARGVHLDVDLMLLKTDIDIFDSGERLSPRRHSPLFLAFIGAKGCHQFGIYLMKLKSFGNSFERVGHLSAIPKTLPPLDKHPKFTHLERKSIIIEEGFDVAFHTSFMRLIPPPGFKALATSRGLSGYIDSMDMEMDIDEPPSEHFPIRIAYMDCEFVCDVVNREKRNYFIISKWEGLWHRFDSNRDSQWRVKMQYGPRTTFELLLGTSKYNAEALLVVPGEVPSRQIRLNGLPGTLKVKIRPRSDGVDRYVQVLYATSSLAQGEGGSPLKNKLLGETFSAGFASPSEYDVILEHVVHD